MRMASASASRAVSCFPLAASLTILACSSLTLAASAGDSLASEIVSSKLAPSGGMLVCAAGLLAGLGPQASAGVTTNIERARPRISLRMSVLADSCFGSLVARDCGLVHRGYFPIDPVAEIPYR